MDTLSRPINWLAHPFAPLNQGVSQSPTTPSQPGAALKNLNISDAQNFGKLDDTIAYPFKWGANKFFGANVDYSANQRAQTEWAQQQYPQPKPQPAAAAPQSPLRVAGDAAQFGPPLPSFDQLARTAPNDPRTLAEVGAHLAHLSYDDLTNGVYAYKGRQANGTMAYGDTPFPNSQLTRMAGKGLTYAGDPNLYPQDRGLGPALNGAAMDRVGQQARAESILAAQQSGGQAGQPAPQMGQAQAAQPGGQSAAPQAAGQTGGQGATPQAGQAAQSGSQQSGGYAYGQDPRLYGLSAAPLSPEQREAYARQVSADRVALIQRTSAMEEQNAILKDQLQGHPAPGVCILGDPNHPNDPDSRVADYNAFQQQAEADYQGLRGRGTPGGDLIAARMARERMQTGVAMRGQDMNYDVEMNRNNMMLRNYMLQRDMGYARMRMEQDNKDRQYGLDQYKVRLEGGRLTLDQDKQNFEAEQSAQKRVEAQIAAAVPAGADGKPDAATAARWSAGLNAYATQHGLSSPAAMGQDQIHKFLAGQRLSDLVQGKGTGPHNPFGSTSQQQRHVQGLRDSRARSGRQDRSDAARAGHHTAGHR
jgi:hypothetical protein